MLPGGGAAAFPLQEVQISIGELKHAELTKCLICDVYLAEREGFTCPKCKRGPLCGLHKFQGKRICTSCAFDIKSRELMEIRNQERGLKGFLRLSEFVFLLCAIFFILMKIGWLESMDFLQETIITDYVVYSMGGVSLIAYGIFYLILLSQKNKMKEIEAVMNTIKYRRLV